MHHIGVDALGRCLQNKQIETGGMYSDEKVDIMSRYPFCLALENSNARDYVTEKVFQVGVFLRREGMVFHSFCRRSSPLAENCSLGVLLEPPS
jgi:hypothetical protein